MSWNHDPADALPGRAAWWLALLQGLYYVPTAVWPLVSMSSFEAVTGPKTDHWLVNTVAVLLLAIGATFLVSAWRRRVPVETLVLGLGCAIALTAIDVVYVSRGVILPVYLLDAAPEVVLIVGWSAVGLAALRRPGPALPAVGRGPVPV